MNNAMSSPSSACLHHPKEPIIGVCHLCLNERLLILAVEKSNHLYSIGYYSQSPANQEMYYGSPRLNILKKSHVKIPYKIFAIFCSSNSRWRRSDLYSEKDGSSSADEDSYISIKFEENGVASWDKGNSISKVYQKPTKLETISNKNDGKKVNKQLEKQGGGLTMWRKWMGHIFQLMRWKRSSSRGCGTCHSQVRTRKNSAKGWLRTLTKRFTNNRSTI